MPKKIPIEAAKEVAMRNDLKQVILLGWDGQMTHVVTYGKTIEDCAQVAQCGNFIKKFMDWPEHLCKAEPSRINKMKKEINKMKKRIKLLECQNARFGDC